MLSFNTGIYNAHVMFAGSVFVRGGSSGINVNRQSCVSFYRPDPPPEGASQRPYLESGHYEMEDEDHYTVAIPLESQKPKTTAPVARDYETPQPIRTSKHEDAGEYSTIHDKA